MSEKVINWIKRQRIKGKSWDSLLLANRASTELLNQFLKSQEDDYDWPPLTVIDWTKIVKEQECEEVRNEEYHQNLGTSVIASSNEQNTFTIPEGETSAWQTYSRKLTNKGFSNFTIEQIKGSTIRILRRISPNTSETGTIKGLVVGNVQSGKTANMAALMAMAADHGWNMFIILSGMMNNLKEQTLKRILEDLDGSRLDWRAIKNPSVACDIDERTSKLDWSEDTRKRYLTVGIKNKVRLEDLLNWLNYDHEAKTRIRLLIIDDEADQASINASTTERSSINKLILDLVNDRDSKHRPLEAKAKAINYVGYTATPYANVLNETPGPESLYPKDFIASLSVSDEYFGPQQIFGFHGYDADDKPNFPGLDVVRNINDSDVSGISDIHEGYSKVIPDTLEAAISWFLCGVAAMRLRDYNKPITMLLHTSYKKEHHDRLRNAVMEWFASTPKNSKLELCRVLWEKESVKFTEKEFFEGYPNYRKMAGGATIIPNPSFEQIKPLLEQLIDEGLKEIQINSDNNHRVYSKGVNLCVDNSSRNEDDNIQKRLMYPEDNEMPEVAPAFLVIGGNTLSRGLTLEGLISTFFIRPAKCADTLMQMGRWFGYRRGYELIPRIWMTSDIKDRFIFMAEMDQKLRDEIREMDQIGISPSECGPKIMNSPSAKFLQIVTANRRQAAVGSDYDFAGHTMETGVFNNNTKDLESNLELTKQFVSSLGTPLDNPYNPYAKSNKVWKNIPWSVIRDYLTKYNFSNRIRGLNELDPFLEWFDRITESGQLGTWNVILAGIQDGPDENRFEITDSIAINKVHRTKITPDRADGTLNIKVLRSFNDFLSDVEVGENDSALLTQMEKIKHTLSALNEMRNSIGLGSTPQIVLYIVDKDSKPKDGSTTRYPLNAKLDIAGFSINIPGDKKTKSGAQSITIDITPKDQFTD